MEAAPAPARLPNEIPPTSPPLKRSLDPPEEERSPKRAKQDEQNPNQQRPATFPVPTPYPTNPVPPTSPYSNMPMNPMNPAGWGAGHYPVPMMNQWAPHPHGPPGGGVPHPHQYNPNMMMSHPAAMYQRPPGAHMGVDPRQNMMGGGQHHVSPIGLPKLPQGPGPQMIPPPAINLPTDSNGQPGKNAQAPISQQIPPKEKETTPTKPKNTKTRTRKLHDQDANFEQALPKRKRKPTAKAKQNQEELEERKEAEAPPEPEQNWEVNVSWPEGSFVKQGKVKKHYSSVQVNDTVYSIGDTVMMWPSPGSTLGPIGTIRKIFDDGNSNTVECVWYYRPEETVFYTKRMKAGPRELYVSEHLDDNPVEAIARKVTVKAIEEIENLDTYIQSPDCFYFQKKYDHVNKRFEDLPKPTQSQ